MMGETFIDQSVYIEVDTEVRYWEDALINGVEDKKGTLIPLRVGKQWKPIIRLIDGVIMDWPQGTVADIHFKVCDQGEYWILDESRQRIAKFNGDFVPGKFLCHGDRGYGDYIILRVGGDGHIKDWKEPVVILGEWQRI